MSGWWYISNGARNGPVSQGELERLLTAGALGPNTLVWTQGMQSWVPAAGMPLASMSPPPLVDSVPRNSLVGTGGMFGMRDYRAHKLLWLLAMPVRLLAWLLYFAFIAAAIGIAQSSGYTLLIQVLIAIVAYEVMAAVGMLVVWILGWIVKRVFLFVVDVTPARGETVEEAKQIALNGDLVWLLKKLERIENWTDEDTEKFVSLINWRSRWFLNARNRFEDRVDILKQHYDETGKRPIDLSPSEIEKLVGHLDDWRACWGIFLDRRSPTL